MIDIILFAIFVIFIGYKLYSVLGQTDYNPENPGNKVLNFPDGQGGVAEVVLQPADDYEELKQKFGAVLAKKIKEIRKYDPDFSCKSFVGGAKQAFEIILESFSKGDKQALKPLLSNEVYQGFASEIDRKNKSGKIEETTLISILKSNIKDIVLSRKIARIAVEIVSEQVNVVRNKDGKIVEGDPSAVDQVSEIWTFSRNLTSANPNWQLVGTKSSG